MIIIVADMLVSLRKHLPNKLRWPMRPAVLPACRPGAPATGGQVRGIEDITRTYIAQAAEFLKSGWWKNAIFRSPILSVALYRSTAYCV